MPPRIHSDPVFRNFFGFKNFFNRFSDFITSRYYSDTAGARLFLQNVDIITARDFLQKHKVSDDFDGGFSMLCVFMFLWQDYFRRHDAFALQQEFMDLTVKLLDDSLRHEGVSDIRIGKKVKQKMQIFYGRLLAYEALFADSGGLAGADLRSRMAILLQKHFRFLDPAYDLADYVIAFRENLGRIELSDMFSDSAVVLDIFKDTGVIGDGL